MKIKSICLFSMLLFSCSWCYGQSWLWVKQGKVTNSNSCVVNAVATDKFGNAYMTGYFQDTVTFGSITLKSFNMSMFIVKYTPMGNVVWAKQSNLVQPMSTCMGTGINIDTYGDVYVAGNFMSAISFGNDTLAVATLYGAQGIFLVKYTQLGNLIWDEQSYPVSQYSDVSSVTTDAKNNVYITGYFEDSIRFGNLLLIDSEYTEVFLIKFNTNGIPLWVKKSTIVSTIAPSWWDESFISTNSVTTDVNGNIFIGGSFYFTKVMFGTFILNTPSNLPLSNQELFIVKYDSMGNVLWAKQTEPAISMQGYAGIMQLATDKSGNLLAAGSMEGTVTFDTNSLVDETGEGYLLKINPLGHFLWAKTNSIPVYTPGVVPYWGVVTGVTTDTLNNIYFLEEGQSNNASSPLYSYPDPSNYTVYVGTSAFNINNYDGSATLLIKYDSTGTVLCSNVINGLNTTDVGNPDDIGGIQLITVIPGGGSVYFGGSVSVLSDYSMYLGDSILFGSDTFKITAQNNTIPFLSKWQPCCPFNASNYDTIKCGGTGVTLTANGGDKYQWSTGNTTSSIMVSPNNNTTYKVAVVVDGGCTDTIYNLVFINSSSINVCCDSSIIKGKSVSLISTGGTSYSWSPDIGLNCNTCPNPIVEPENTTTYTLIAINDSGCISTRTVTIDVRCGEVFVPDIFSPNQHINNILYVRGPCISTLDFMVFDRWGNKVFESANLNNGWDGTNKGQPMNTGTYMYYAKATLFDGAVVEKKGSVTLVR